jgi:hypothetical protein
MALCRDGLSWGNRFCKLYMVPARNLNCHLDLLQKHRTKLYKSGTSSSITDQQWSLTSPPPPLQTNNGIGICEVKEESNNEHWNHEEQPKEQRRG